MCLGGLLSVFCLTEMKLDLAPPIEAELSVRRKGCFWASSCWRGERSGSNRSLFVRVGSCPKCG
jgi:hypothetical protein